MSTTARSSTRSATRCERAAEAEHQEPGVSDGEEEAAPADVAAADSGPREPSGDGGAATGDVDAADSGTLEERAARLDTAEIGESERPVRGVTGARRPAAGPRPRGVSGGPNLSFGFNLAKIAGQGEDSDPIVRDGRELGLVAVFDGMGGAGGTVYETPDGPVPVPTSRPGSPGTSSSSAWSRCSTRSGTWMARQRRADLTRSVERALAEHGWRGSRHRPAACGRGCCGRCRPRWRWWRCSAASLASGAGPVTSSGAVTRASTSSIRRPAPTSSPATTSATQGRDGEPAAGLGGEQRDVRRHRLRRPPPPGRAHRAVPRGGRHRWVLRVPAPRCTSSTSCSRRCGTPRTPRSWSAACRQRSPRSPATTPRWPCSASAPTTTSFRQLFAQRTAELEQRWVTPLDDLEAEVGRASRRSLEERAPPGGSGRRSCGRRTSRSYERYLGREEDG